MPNSDDFDDRTARRRDADDRHDDFNRGGIHGFEDRALPYSRFGIAAFILAILSYTLLFLFILVEGTMAQTHVRAHAASNMVLGLILFALVGTDVIAIGLAFVGLRLPPRAFVGLRLPRRNRLFGYLGLVVGGLVLLLLCGFRALATSRLFALVLLVSVVPLGAAAIIVAILRDRSRPAPNESAKRPPADEAAAPRKGSSLAKILLWVGLAVGLAMGLGVILLALLFGALSAHFHKQEIEVSKAISAREDEERLSDACWLYWVDHNNTWPPNLEALLVGEEKREAILDDPKVLDDPWGNRYQYDPLGPRNGGRRPDIWTRSPEGKEIGNWPGGLK
jgi:hypothetical protein